MHIIRVNSGLTGLCLAQFWSLERVPWVPLRLSSVGCAGSPINVVVIGGSITCGGNTYTEDQRWINQVLQWINATWPHPEHKLKNACKPATPSMLFSFCMHQSVPDDTDLLFMEVREPARAGSTGPDT